jgi:hypothetical protein
VSSYSQVQGADFRILLNGVLSTNGINADPETILCDGQISTSGASAFSTHESGYIIKTATIPTQFHLRICSSKTGWGALRETPGADQGH